MAHVQLEPTSAEMQKCIQDCLDCYDICIQTEARCVKKGGKHADPKHLQLLADCARICQVSAELMLRDSRYHMELCGLCAKACDDCAKACERLDGDAQMRKCAEICATCAESCRAMAN